MAIGGGGWKGFQPRLRSQTGEAKGIKWLPSQWSVIVWMGNLPRLYPVQSTSLPPFPQHAQTKREGQAQMSPAAKAPTGVLVTTSTLNTSADGRAPRVVPKHGRARKCVATAASWASCPQVSLGLDVGVSAFSHQEGANDLSAHDKGNRMELTPA